MKLSVELAESYNSPRQKARVITESWVAENCNCPFCGGKLEPFPNNNKCSDFKCSKCSESFELKSKKGKFSKTINGAEYKTTLEKVRCSENPNWLLLEHDGLNITGLVLIPKYFIYDEMVIPREPLGQNARRAGWQGCKLDLKKLPSFGKISLIKDCQITECKIVNFRLKQAEYFKKSNIKEKGWKLEILSYVDSFSDNIFTYNQMKRFFPLLKETHPNNNNVDKKVSQVLQQLRDSGFIKFVDNDGLYMKLF